MKLSLSVVATSLIASIALAQDFERIAPQVPTPEKVSGATAADTAEHNAPTRLAQPDVTLIKDLRALRLVSSDAAVQTAHLEQYAGVIVEPSVDLLAKSKNFPRELGEAFLHKPLTHAKLEMLRQEIVQRYVDKGHPVVTVSLPPQDVTDGVLQLVVSEARVGKVRVEGNRYFKSERIAGQVRAQTGETVSTNQLLADVALLNQNPFRNVDVVFEPGADSGTTNVILRTTDRRPFRVYAGYDDEGVDITGKDRLFAGFNWGDAFLADGLLSYQHTTSPDFRSESADSLTYTTALPWRHMATLFGSYGTLKADTLDSLANTSGNTLQLGLRYTIPMAPQTGRFTHSLVLGFDFKRTNNNLAFGGESISKTKINVGQFMVGYNAGYKTNQSNTTLNMEGYYNPGSWVGDDTTADYQALRADAKSQYAYVRGVLDHTQNLPHHFTATATLTGQLSTGNLIPTETIGLGGYGSVRGYDERIVNADRALIASTELRTPAIAPLQTLGVKKVNDQLQFLAFIDYGIAGNSQLLPNERSSEQLLGVGPGLRYTIDDWLSVRLDYGFALKKIDEGGDTSRLHLSATISY